MNDERPHEPKVTPSAETDEFDAQAEFHGLASPMRSRSVRAFVLGGPLGLLVALLVGLWSAKLTVERSAVIQAHRVWIPGEQLAVRALLVDGALTGVAGTTVDIRLERKPANGVSVPGSTSVALATLASVVGSGVAQGTLRVPQLALGPATLEFTFRAPGQDVLIERIPIEIAATRPARTGELSISRSTLQWADDTQPQPKELRLDLRPSQRLVAGFENRLFARVVDPRGRPWVGPVQLVLVDGEFMGTRGREGDPPTLMVGHTDALGLVTLRGDLTSEVLRVELRVLADLESRRVVHARRFRLVSYAGAVAVDGDRRALRAGESMSVVARGLGGKRPVFVDMFDREGAWIDTLQPPVLGGEPPRSWQPPASVRGVVQLEAYHYTNDPGESAAVTRVQRVEGAPTDSQTLQPLLQLQRAALKTPRVESSFDVEVERGYLDAIEDASLNPEQVATAREFLLDTLPLFVFGPPAAVVTRAREDEALAHRKAAWKLGLRVFVLGGGGLFIALLAWVLLRDHVAAAKTTHVALQQVAEPHERAELAVQIRQARTHVLLRAGGILIVMVLSLVMTLVLLENLL